VTLGEKQRQFTQMIAQLIDYAYTQGYSLSFGEAWRTKEQQALYVQTGKSGTMNSRHLQRLAVDFNLFIAGVYQQRSEAYLPLGEFWESLHPDNVWGGRWTSPVDGNHFELKP
jgi:hypothetical protein